MITEKRLNELIKQEGTIYFYSKDYGIIEEFNLKGCELYNDFDNIQLVYENEPYDLENLYETKAEAEFVAKYKNIERTETLDLPTWEEAEIDELVKSGKSKNGCWNLIKGFTDKKKYEMFEFSLSSDDDNQFYLSVNNEDSSYKDLFYKPLTYENYLEACELCKKLFEGEEV